MYEKTKRDIKNNLNLCKILTPYFRISEIHANELTVID